jgi:hypothetical protein
VWHPLGFAIISCQKKPERGVRVQSSVVRFQFECGHRVLHSLRRIPERTSGDCCLSPNIRILTLDRCCSLKPRESLAMIPHGLLGFANRPHASPGSWLQRQALPEMRHGLLRISPCGVLRLSIGAHQRDAFQDSPARSVVIVEGSCR